MRPRRIVRFFLALALPCFLATAMEAGTVSGTVRNGTTGKPAAGVQVILIQLQGAMQPVATTTTDSEGRYRFDHPALGTGPMLIRAVYRGVNYHEPATPGSSTVNVEVFEPTEKLSAFDVTARAVILDPNGPDLRVGEEFLIKNTTQPPVAYYRPNGSFVFSLPAGAQIGDVSVVGISGMPIKQTPVEKGGNAEAIDYPFRPGETQVRMSYRMPYPSNQATIRLVSPYKADRVAILAPPSVQVSGSGFSPAGTEEGLNVYMRDGVAANVPFSIAVSGTAPLGSPGSAAGGGGGGDDSQNPSVNSRADSGGAAPTASITTMPARLDGVQWAIVGGFAAVFALGLLLLWRQPQTAPAGKDVPQSPRPEARDAAPGRKAPAQKSATAEVEREAHSSLDELKDSLFRLELRHEAGTISEEEYARERRRLQNLLRDLVKS
jgi:hypothetical protein